MRIPDDIYDSVFEISTRLVSAREVEDSIGFWNAYNELRQYCEVQDKLGNRHPFMWEALADFTVDDKIAVELYLKALSAATSPEAIDYRASIQFELAERYERMGDIKVAYEFALAADAEARKTGDLELRQNISEFLLNKSEGRGAS